MFELNPRVEDFYFWTRVTVYSAKLRSCRTPCLCVSWSLFVLMCREQRVPHQIGNQTSLDAGSKVDLGAMLASFQ